MTATLSGADRQVSEDPMAALVGVEDDIKASPKSPVMYHYCALVGYSWVITGKSINTKSLTNNLFVGKNTAELP